MAQRSYRRLESNGRFLKGTGIESQATDILREEGREAEDMAAMEIDAALGTRFTEGSEPPLIRLLADLIGSAYVLEFAAFGSSFGKDGEGTRKPDYLRRKAQQILDDLREHKTGLLLADGTYHALYPAPDVLPLAAEGPAKALTVDSGLTWGQMAQPTMSDAEKDAMDAERGRRTGDLEAAYAGAYGL